ncbi:MAG: DUF4268 domain-containing protein, partial [Acidobacteria bacterium]|nr:DUF4268 domain-containing protein [Acidobacteriota bacterium]
LAEGRSNCRRFLDELLARAKETTSLHTGVSAGSTNWVGTGAGKSGLVFNYWARKHDASVHLDIDRGKDSEEQNKAIFDEFQRHKDDIEAKFGGSLDWQRLEGKQVCRIRKNIDVGGYADDEEWPQIHNAMIDAMIRLAKALQPHIDRIKIAPSPP